MLHKDGLMIHGLCSICSALSLLTSMSLMPRLRHSS